MLGSRVDVLNFEGLIKKRICSTSGSTGMYCRGSNKGIRTAVTPRMAI